MRVEGDTGTTSPSTAGRRPRTALDATIREILFVVLGLAVYFGVRVLIQDDGYLAFVNAAAIARFEETLRIAWEIPIQQAVLGHLPLVRLFNWVYIWGHWPVLIAIICFLYTRHRPAYRRLRTAMVISGTIGLAIFLSFPVAPPRLADADVVDTIALYDPTYQEVGGRSRFTNQYAAMPSFHFGWNLLGGLCLASALRRRTLRALVVVFPFLMALAITATGNHYLLDAVAGGGIALLGLALARALEARSGDDLAAAAARRRPKSALQRGVGSG